MDIGAAGKPAMAGGPYKTFPEGGASVKSFRDNQSSRPIVLYILGLNRCRPDTRFCEVIRVLSTRFFSSELR